MDVQCLIGDDVEVTVESVEPMDDAEVGGKAQTQSLWNRARCLGCRVMIGLRTLPNTTPLPSL